MSTELTQDLKEKFAKIDKFFDTPFDELIKNLDLSNIEDVTDVIDAYANKMLSDLLLDDVLFLSWGEMKTTIKPVVICNDWFYWACADAEPISLWELPSLYKTWTQDKILGPSIWCSFHRNLQPQQPWVKKLKELNLWTPELDALPEASPS